MYLMYFLRKEKLEYDTSSSAIASQEMSLDFM